MSSIATAAKTVVGAKEVAQRANWADIAKGLSIILVVFHHSIPRPPFPSGLPEWLYNLDNTLALFRLPLFFFVSGMFISSLMKASFADLWQRRLVNLFYLLLLWALIREALTNTGRLWSGAAVDLSGIAYIFVEPPLTLWFIYALALFTLAVWILRGINGIRLILLASAIYVAGFGGDVIYPEAFFEKLPRLFLWFCLGYVCAHLAMASVERVRVYHLLFVVLWGTLAYGVMSRTEGISWVFFLPFSACAIGSGIILSALLDRTLLAGPLAYVGRNTLPIYVSHFIVTEISIRIAVAPQHSLLKLGITVTLGVILPIFVYEFAIRCGQSWPYRAPAWLVALPKQIWTHSVGRGL